MSAAAASVPKSEGGPKKCKATLRSMPTSITSCCSDDDDENKGHLNDADNLNIGHNSTKITANQQDPTTMKSQGSLDRNHSHDPSCTELPEESEVEADDFSHDFFTSTYNGTVPASTAQWLDTSRHSGVLSMISQCSLFQTALTSVAHPVQGLNQFAVTCIIVNYISAGYILLPYVFAQAGIVLAIFCFVIVSSQSYLTAIFLLETCARAEALEHFKSSEMRVDQDNYSMAIRNRKFELPALTKIFLGETWSRFFSLTTALDLYGITWTFAVVFGQNLSENLPILGSEQDDYQLYVSLFLIVSIPLSCLSILDQLWVQMAFLLARTGMVLMMIISLVIAYAHPDQAYFDSRPSGAALDMGGGSAFATFGSLIAVLQTCIFATAFQFSIPGVTGISADRKQIVSSVRVAVGFAFVTNLTVAILTAYYFGKQDCEESNNLNWIGFHGRSDAVGARIVSNYVVLMAAVDSLAVYPLNAIPLGEGLMAAVYGHSIDDTVAESKWCRAAFRLLASLPQGIGALWVHNLGSLAKYAGIFTLLSYTVCPSFLYLRSEQKMAEQKLPTKTHYSHPLLSNPGTAYALIVGSLLLILGVAIDASL